jgi:hypothetical protein
MRITFVTIIILLGLHIGMVGMDNLKDMQDKRMDQLCKVEPSYCK